MFLSGKFTRMSINDRSKAMTNSSGQRIDRSMIVDMSEEVLDEYICGICHEIFVNPMVTMCCRQTYCNECISQWLLTSRSCPNDRKPLTQSGLNPPPRAMINVMNSMKIKCKYSANGCQTTVKVCEMAAHLKTCNYNICENCGSGRGADERHSSELCINILKAKVESFSTENIRLTHENKELIQEIKRIRDENRELKLKTSDMKSIPIIPSTSRQSMVSHTEEPSLSFRDKINKISNNFIDGKFILVSKYKSIGSGQRVYTKTDETTLEIILNGNNYLLIRSQTGLKDKVKKFSLGQPSQWVRSDGKYFESVFEQDHSIPNKTRWIETVEDLTPTDRNKGKTTDYYYDFSIQTRHLSIEWTVGSVKKVEVFSRNE